MVWRFRKSFGRGPFRLTLGKKGITTSVGMKGLRVSSGPGGEHVTTSLPGMGLSNRERLSAYKATHEPEISYGKQAIVVACLFVFGLGLMVHLGSRGRQPPLVLVPESERQRFISAPAHTEELPPAPILVPEPRYRTVTDITGDTVSLDGASMTYHLSGCPNYKASGMREPGAKFIRYRRAPDCVSREFNLVTTTRRVIIEPEPVLAIPTADAARPADRSYIPTSNQPASTGGRIQIRGYTRKDGTYVPPHTRARGN